MREASQFGRLAGCSWFRRLALVLPGCVLLALPSFGQAHGYPLPSVSSIGAHYLPFPRPSVSSMGPYYAPAYRHHQPYSNRLNRGYGFSGSGWAYAAPYYYIPFGGYGYADYDYVGGPDMYSGPPIGPNDPALHMIVEQPPTQSYRPAPPEDVQAEITPPPQITPEQPPAARETTPREPTVLVFRDGHQQEVSNYAIMGQTVYVLDDRIQKIPLTNLDVSATVKANDDRGMEFKIPATTSAAQKKNSDLQPNGTPQQTPNPGTSVASVLP